MKYIISENNPIPGKVWVNPLCFINLLKGLYLPNIEYGISISGNSDPTTTPAMWVISNPNTKKYNINAIAICVVPLKASTSNLV